MSEEDNNTSDNFGLHLDKKSTLDEQDIQRDHKDLVSKSSNTGTVK